MEKAEEALKHLVEGCEGKFVVESEGKLFKHFHCPICGTWQPVAKKEVEAE